MHPRGPTASALHIPRPELSGQHWKVLFISGMGFFTDAYDLFIIGVVTGHGISAAMGKLGGFLGVFLFPFLMHWAGLSGAEAAAAVASLIGFFVTARMLPETKGKSLEEIEREEVSTAEKVAA